MSDKIKQAEQRGYTRGYNAGRKRQQTDIKQAQKMKRMAYRWNQAFLAALPACIIAQNWKVGGKPIASLTERTALARDFADEAIKHMRGE